MPADRPSLLSGTKSAAYRIKKLAWLVPLLFFGLLTTLFTFPMIFSFFSKVPGVAEADRLQNLWNFWWIDKAIMSGRNPYHTDALFFPFYQAPNPPLLLYYHDLQLLNGVVTLPLQWWGGVAAAYNGTVFIATFLSGLGAYLLVRQLGGSRGASLLGGSVYAFAPIRLDAIAQSITNIQSTEFLPFYALCLQKSLNRPAPGQRFWAGLNFRWLGGAILALTCCIYTDWYNTIYLLAYSLFFLIWQVLKSPGNLFRVGREIFSQGVIGIFTFILVAPLLVPSILHINDPNFLLVPGLDRDIKSSSTLVSLFLPGGFGADWHTCALGYCGLLAGAGAVIFLFQKKAGPGWLTRGTCFYWLALTVWAIIMALGPQLRLTATDTTDLPLPYALFRLLPAVSITRAPSRFLILAMLGLAVLAAFTFDWLRGRLAQRRPFRNLRTPLRARVVSLLMVGVSLGLLLLESWSPLPLFSTTSNPFIEKLAQEPGNFNLLELPITRNTNLAQVRMFNQITYQRPILGGYLSRPVVDPYRDNGSPFLPIADLILRTKRIPLDIIPPRTNQQDLDTLVALYNFRYIILYLQEFSDPDQRAGVIDLITTHYGSQQLVYQDSTIAVFRVPDQYLSRPYEGVQLSLGDGWYDVEQDNSKTYWRWTQPSATMYATTFTPQTVQLSLTLRSKAVPQTLQILVNGELAAQLEIEPTLFQSPVFPIKLNKGVNEIKLVSANFNQTLANMPPPPGTDTRQVAFAVTSIQVSDP